MKFLHQRLLLFTPAVLLACQPTEAFVTTGSTRRFAVGSDNRQHLSRKRTPPKMMLDPFHMNDAVVRYLMPSLELVQRLPTLDLAQQLAQSVHQNSFLVELWGSYMTLLKTNPVETKTATAATLCFTGDAVAQLTTAASSMSESEDTRSGTKISSLLEKYDPKRGMAFLLFGALYTGCFQHHWFNFMNQNIVDWGEDLHVWGHAAKTDIPLGYYMDHTGSWWEYFDVKAQISTVMDKLQAPPSKAEIAAAKVALNQFLTIPFVYMPLFFTVSGLVGGLTTQQSLERGKSLFVPLLQRNYMFWLPTQFIQFYALPPELQVPFVCVASLCWTVILSTISSSQTQTQETSSAVAAEEVVIDTTAVAVASNAPDDFIDSVTADDVQEALVPQSVRDTVGRVVEGTQALPPGVTGGTGGVVLGLIASAADEAALIDGAATAMDVGTGVAVAAVAAAGGAVGFAVSRKGKGEAGNDELLDATQPLEASSFGNSTALSLSDDDVMKNDSSPSGSSGANRGESGELLSANVLS